METHLKPFWNRLFSFNSRFGLFLILIICVPRFILVLNANFKGNFNPLITLIMTISAIAPFVFLSKNGREAIGIKKTKKYGFLLFALLSGLAASIILHYLGQILYGNTFENWYVYIGKLYNIPQNIKANDKLVFFAIIALTSMTFSPVGEELFFRGIVHASFSNSFGEKKASIIDSFAFALTHISHFGLVFISNSWSFYTIPAIIWVSSMFLVSTLFFWFKKRAGSILGAIVCHAAFNLGMTYCIIYGL